MKKLTLILMFCLAALVSYAQEYSVCSAGQGKTGSYLVDVTISIKKIEPSAEDLALRCAVHGVMFRGLLATSAGGEQKALIQDPHVEQTHAAWFDAFFAEGRHRNFATINGQSLMVMKNKKTKMNEIKARVIVNKESLYNYLETNGIVQGFSNLW